MLKSVPLREAQFFTVTEILLCSCRFIFSGTYSFCMCVINANPCAIARLEIMRVLSLQYSSIRRRNIDNCICVFAVFVRAVYPAMCTSGGESLRSVEFLRCLLRNSGRIFRPRGHLSPDVR